jgi:hypothetical protein
MVEGHRECQLNLVDRRCDTGNLMKTLKKLKEVLKGFEKFGAIFESCSQIERSLSCISNLLVKLPVDSIYKKLATLRICSSFAYDSILQQVPDEFSTTKLQKDSRFHQQDSIVTLSTNSPQPNYFL